jgi:hypothetical protein
MKNIHKIIFGHLPVIILLSLLIPANVHATVYTLDLALTGQQEVPANASTATGTLVGTYNDATNTLSFTLMFNALTAPATAAHFHGPATPGNNAPVQIPLTGFPAATSGTYTNSFVLTDQQESDLLCGLWYVNIHNSVFPGGEIRSQVKEGTTSGNITTFAVALLGQNDVPPTLTPATGTFIGTFDNSTSTLSFTIMFNGLVANTTAAHIHGPAAAGANAGVIIPFVGFPTGVTSGTYTNSYVLTPTQVGWLNSGLLYVNVHTTTFPGGEIRGQLTEGTLIGDCGVKIPTLSQWALIILGFLLLATGTIYIYRRQNSLEFARGDKN